LAEATVISSTRSRFNAAKAVAKRMAAEQDKKAKAYKKVANKKPSSR